MLETGYLLSERYEISEKIGQGGMSYVYRATDRTMGRVVAIKVLKEEFSEDEEFIRKFKNEARAAARLTHPNIVAAYDVVDEGELHYIVMELVEGITLKNYISRKGRLSSKETIGIALQAAEGIGEAHKKGIIHRDIKPQNMIISRDGKVKVADFGIAKAVSGETVNAAVIGSVHYIAPEQARSGIADVRSDLYSLGITMYEMITGRVPYEGENTVNVVMAHLSEAMVPPSVYNPEIYPALNDIILKACRKRPEERYQSAAELSADLKRCLREPEGHFAYPGGGRPKTGADGAEEAAETESGRPGEAPVQEASAEEKTEGRNASLKAEQGAGSLREGRAERDTPQAEITRLMRYGSIGAAVLILLILLMIGTRISGVFHAYSPKEETEASTEAETGDGGSSESTYQISIPSEDQMPDLLGMSVQEAKAELAQKGVRVSLDSSRTEFSDSMKEGFIMEQSPEAREVVKPGDTVYVTVSRGSQASDTLKKLRGMKLSEAEAALSEAKLAVKDIRSEASSDVEEGRISAFEAQDAQGNSLDLSEVSAGDSVVLIVSSGAEETLRVPALHNLTQEAAKEKLAEAGLTLGEVVSQNSDIEAGLVIGQSPEANGEIAPGGSVSIVVSLGPETETQALGSSGSGKTESSGEKSGHYYYGSIDTVSRAGVASGPNSSELVNIEIRLMQRGPHSFEYITLGELKGVPAGTEFPVSYSSIQGIYGVTEGEIQVVNSDTGDILDTFDITFAPRG